MIEKEDESYAIDLKRIDYQRKRLDNYGWSNLPKNLSFNDDKEAIKRMIKSGRLKYKS